MISLRRSIFKNAQVLLLKEQQSSAMKVVCRPVAQSCYHTHEINQSHQQKLYSTTTARRSQESAESESQKEEEYTFTHPRAKEMFDKMAALDKEEIHLMAELINEKLGITITEADKRGGFGSAPAGSGAGAGEAVEEVVEKTAFDLKLTGFDAKSKIKVIKEIRTITGLGLKEAKAMVDEAPKTVKKDIKKEEAEELKAKLEAVGATVEID